MDSSPQSQKSTFREEWTSLWVQQYSNSTLYQSRGDVMTSPSRDGFLFSPPQDLTSLSSPPKSNLVHTRSRSYHEGPPIKLTLPLSIHKKQGLVRSNTAPSRRTPRPQPPEATDMRPQSYGEEECPVSFPEEPSYVTLSRVHSKRAQSRKRPVPIILSQDSDTLSPMTSPDGPIVVTPSWQKVFAKFEGQPSPTSPASETETASSFDSSPATPLTSVPAVNYRSFCGGSASPQTPAVVSPSAASLFVPLSAASSTFRLKPRPAQDVPLSVVEDEDGFLDLDTPATPLSANMDVDPNEDGGETVDDWDVRLIQETHFSISVNRASLIGV